MKQLITFETAKLAKEKGFDLISNNPAVTAHNVGKRVTLTGHNLPPQSVLSRWLREKHNIHVNPISNFTARFGDYNLEIVSINKGVVNSIIFREKGRLKSFFDSHEEALEKGLQEALKLINPPIT